MVMFSGNILSTVNTKSTVRYRVKITTVYTPKQSVYISVVAFAVRVRMNET